MNNSKPTVTAKKKPTSQVCPICATVKKSLKEHYLAKHPESILKCAECSYASLKSSSLTQHMISKHGKVEVKQSVGPKIDLNGKGKEEVISKFKCQKCLFETADKVLITTHYNNCHKVEILVDTNCSYIASDKNDLEKHKLKKCRGRVKSKYICRQCPFVSSKKLTVANHMVDNHSTDTSCWLCAFVTNENWNLIQHIRDKHVSKQTSDKEINSAIQLLITECKITNEDFKCSLCEFLTGSKNKLKRHIKEHYPKCEFCDFRGVFVGSMDQHLKTKHCYNKSKFVCNFCEFTSVKYDVFTEHLDTVHKHFKCWFPDCEFMSQDVIFLAQHITDDHGWNQTGYECHCGFEVEYSFSLGQHKRDKHRAKILSKHLASCQSFSELDIIFQHQ